MITIQADEQDTGVRLDRLIRKRLALRRLSDIYRLLRTGAIKVNGGKRSQKYRIQQGDAITIDLPEAELTGPARAESSLENLVQTGFYRHNFRVLFEDRHILACDKPERLVVHAGTGHAGHDSLVDLATAYLLHSGGKKTIAAPGLVHRLDKDTSGVILLAKDKQTVRDLHRQLRERTVTKEYIAFCHGAPPKKAGTVTAGLRRTHERNAGMKMRVDRQGEAAISSYRVTGARGGVSRLRIELHTGKTHQIRAHMSHTGAPVLGDVRYGTPDEDAQLLKRLGAHKRLYLHAWRIEFAHPHTGERIEVTAPEPAAFGELWERLERGEGARKTRR